MASIIKIKRSTTPGAVPSGGALAAGELAVNLSDRIIFSSSDGSDIVRLSDSALGNTNAAISNLNTNLTGTNTAIRTLVSTQTSRVDLINTNLTSTNTALRTLISDRIQVANASATYQTIDIERAALANTNAYIATKLGAADPETSGLLAHTGRATISTNLAVTGNTTIGGNLVVDGNLTVEGAVTYISTSTLNADDSMIKLAANNAADTIDTGIYGKYVESSTDKYTGYFRDASDGVVKFYTGLQTEPTTTVNTGATGYTLAQIDAIIDGGTY